MDEYNEGIDEGFGENEVEEIGIDDGFEDFGEQIDWIGEPFAW